MFFEVIPTTVYRQGGGALTYSSDLPLIPGQLVLVPIGSKSVPGIIWRKVAKVDFPTKPIIRILHPTPLPKHLLDAIVWMSHYYLTPLPTVANLILPTGLMTKNALGAPTKKSEVEGSKRQLRNTNTNIGIDLSFSGAPATNEERIERGAPVTTGRAEVSPEKTGRTNVNSLNVAKLPLIPLNSAQKKALEALQQAPGATKLLRGVTGSGKTNIYLKMAADTLRQQKSVILLVPEIALTSQLVKIFEETFGQRVILIHSNQTMTERRSTWLHLLETTAPLIVIGPRSALFAPLANLGLIIIDEAHENAYYQENAPRYSALRLASFIAHDCKIPCIQGTATPNIVDYHLAKTHSSLVELSEKAKTTAITPEIKIIDFKDRANFLKNRYFSNDLLTAIENNLQAEHQTLIFHNRRGSAPMTLCEECGWQALCPNCYLPLTLHSDGYMLTCHICGHESKVPSSCPECHQPGIIHKGFGTKLLETELTRLFPKAKIARFDGDNKKDADLTSLYDDVKSGKINLLIGTQTLARGLDLPKLATVGIVQADAGLSLPDFSAEERAFELLTQVVGRVGRGHLDTASVIVQTYQPDHPVINTALRADFQTFAKYLLAKRHKQQLPPYTYLARLAITYKTEKTTLKKIQLAHATLSQNPGLQLSPPMPAFHERTARGYTWQITIKSTSRNTLLKALAPFSMFHLEIDPPSLL